MKLIFKKLLAAAVLAGSLTSALAQGTAFTYQGQLSSGGSPANGDYDLTFTLYNASSGGTIISGPITNSSTPVTNGLFTVMLNFGGAFNGNPRWLEVGVRATGGEGAFTSLSPLQEVTPAPYAEFAATAGATSNGWTLTGNAGTTPGTDFLGTTDNEPLQLRANGIIAMNLQGNPDNNNSVNISGGYWAAVGLNIFGVTDFGGGDGGPNYVYANFDAIGGGFNNSINPGATFGTIPGGSGNVVSGAYGFAAGQQAQALHSGAFVWSDGAGGAFASTADDQFNIHATGGVRVVTGGAGMTIDGVAVTGGGGAGSGWSLTGNAGTTPGTDFLGTTDNEPLQLRANGVIAMNLQGNPNNNNSVNISGGYWAAVGANVFGVTDFGGGDGGPNSVYANFDTIGGGFNNTINSGATYATIPGGNGNVVSGSYGFAAGQQAQAVNAGSFVWSDGVGGAFSSSANDQFNIHATGGVRIVTGGAGMTIDGVAVTGGGGGGGGSGWSLTGNAGTTPGVDFLGTTDNAALDFYVDSARALQLQPTSDSPNVLGGANINYIASGAFGATIAGGGSLSAYGAAYSNSVFSANGAIGGGLGNSVRATEGTIAGGNQNVIQSGANDAVVGGGYQNTISGNAYRSTIGGGAGNTVGGPGATVPGGLNNSATGLGSFAAGQNASTSYNGSFIWGDGTQAAAGTGANRFEVLASGGVNFYGSPINFYTSGGPASFYGNVGVNTASPSQALEVNGEFMMVDGLSGLQCYVGDDGYGNDVQLGSLVSGVTQVSCYNEADQAYMALNVSSITIHGGSDLAEPFKISKEAKEISQGSVLVIDDQNPGQLKLSDQPYDTRVAGVVSGANGIHPGIQMRQQGALDGGTNVALTGRVYVHADASYGAIRPGDLLTTSATPGCAMKVADHAKAQGAILGKAMSGLSDGKGMVLVLVTLQ